MPTDPNILLAEAKCYACFSPASIGQLLRLALLRRMLLAVNPGADVSAQSLMAYAKCYQCMGLDSAQMAEMALLDQINQSLP